MKVKTIVTDITFDDLVELISTAFTGSYFLVLDYHEEVYLKCPDRKEDDCIEEKTSRILLNGGSVTFSDMYAEDADDFYGSKLPHDWNESSECIDYTVTLKDIEKGLAKVASESFGYANRSFYDLVNHEDGNLDQPEAEFLVQYILWGEEIY